MALQQRQTVSDCGLEGHCRPDPLLFLVPHGVSYCNTSQQKLGQHRKGQQGEEAHGPFCLATRAESGCSKYRVRGPAVNGCSNRRYVFAAVVYWVMICVWSSRTGDVLAETLLHRIPSDSSVLDEQWFSHAVVNSDYHSHEYAVAVHGHGAAVMCVDAYALLFTVSFALWSQIWVRGDVLQVPSP